MLPPFSPHRTQFLEMVIRFLAEGAASGLNVIAVYVTEILKVTGFDGGYHVSHYATYCCLCPCTNEPSLCDVSAGVRNSLWQ